MENFEKPDESKKEVIEKMKEVINKLEDGLNKMGEDNQSRVESPKLEPKVEATEVEVIEVNPAASEVDKVDPEVKTKKKLSKIKKSKKLRLLQEKKVRSFVSLHSEF